MSFCERNVRTISRFDRSLTSAYWKLFPFLRAIN
jgi:hypothetical protein